MPRPPTEVSVSISLFFIIALISCCNYIAETATIGPSLGRLEAHLPRDSLGVHRAQLFARAPVSGVEKVVALNVWLKRASPSNSKFQLPTQNDALEGFAWADDLTNLTSNRWLLLSSTVDSDWKPQLRLQVWGKDDVILPIHYPPLEKPGARTLGKPWSNLLAYSFTFRLDSLPNQRDLTCFKVYEDSLPDNKAPFCLPATSRELCDRLAPDATFTPAQPALWAVMIPFRAHGLSGGQWEIYTRRLVRRLEHFVGHLRLTGARGLLLYVDRFSGPLLATFPEVVKLLEEGILAFVDWDTIERMEYMYDQGLVYSHAFLGLSSCGANLWLQPTDVDELLHSPTGGSWLDTFECLNHSTGSPNAAFIRMPRYDILATGLSGEQESALWYSSPEGAVGSEGGGGGGGALGLHPLEWYDRIAVNPHPLRNGKYVACPARRMSSVWMHTAAPVHGTWHEGDPACGFFLHVANYWRPRVFAHNGTWRSLELHLTRKPLLRRLLMGS